MDSESLPRSRARGSVAALPQRPEARDSAVSHRDRWLVVSVFGSFVLYCLFFLLMQAQSMRIAPTRTLARWPRLRVLVDLLTPEALASVPPDHPLGVVNKALYLLVAVGLVALWLVALRLVRSDTHPPGLLWLLLPVLLFGAPLVMLPGMFSSDLSLYAFYGRIIAEYGENPILMAPREFSGDPSLGWVNWKHLPSSYGPVWLMLSGLLSYIAGAERFPIVFTYKMAALALHLAVTLVVWSGLRRTRPALASWGVVFCGWNPMMLIETVGSGHNDVLVSLFVTLAAVLAVGHRWLWGVFVLTAATMVKVNALLLLPLLVLRWMGSLSGIRARVGAAVSSLLLFCVSALLLYAPLWAGWTLLRNVRTNPAATEYENSLWHLLNWRYYVFTGREQYIPSQYLDGVRNVFLVAVLLFIALRVWRGWDLRDAWVWLWIVYCLSASWIWPWYFVIVVPLAALRGPNNSALLAVGLTVGAMLFWLGWPRQAVPNLPLLYEYRSVLLFAPVLAVMVWILFRSRSAAQSIT